MTNFGPLTADIGSGVRGTPANSSGLLVLAALLHGTIVGVSQTLRHMNRQRHLFIIPQGGHHVWALAHILVQLLAIALLVPQSVRDRSTIAGFICSDTWLSSDSEP